MLSRFAALSIAGSSTRLPAAALLAARASATARLASTAAAAAATAPKKKAPAASPSATTKKTATSAKSKPAATKKAAAAKKTAAAAKKKKAAPKKKAAAPKKKAAPKKAPAPKPWVRLDADGKPVPLPQETRPRLLPAYILFMKDHFSNPEVREQTGSKAPQDLLRGIANQWKSLPQADKQKYLDAAAAAKETYPAELETWKASLTPDDIQRQNEYERYLNRRRQAALKKSEAGDASLKVPTKRRSLALRDPLKPKRPISPFFHFMGDYRIRHYETVLAAHDSVKAAQNQLAKDAAKEWNSFSAETKQPYEDRFKRDNENYHVAVKAYELRNTPQ